MILNRGCSFAQAELQPYLETCLVIASGGGFWHLVGGVGEAANILRMHSKNLLAHAQWSEDKKPYLQCDGNWMVFDTDALSWFLRSCLVAGSNGPPVNASLRSQVQFLGSDPRRRHGSPSQCPRLENPVDWSLAGCQSCQGPVSDPGVT